MTEEIKKCDCKEKAIKKAQEFVFIAGAVFVGATLAILLSANILKPKCHCPCPIHPPMFAQPMPPAPMINHGYRSEFGGPGEGFRPHNRMIKRQHFNHRDIAQPSKDFEAPQPQVPPKSKK